MFNFRKSDRIENANLRILQSNPLDVNRPG